MKILFVAMTQSIHTARWINQIVDQGWDIHIFPSWDLTIHPKLQNITIHGFKVKPKDTPDSVKIQNFSLSQELLKKNFLFSIINKASNRFKFINKLTEKFIKKGHSIFYDYSDEERCNELVKTIKKIKPDIIHSLEMQHGGYLTLEAKKLYKKNFPTWIVTNWGADIHHFGQFPEHAIKIQEVLENCNYYGCECKRDVDLGRKFGFKGEVLPVTTNTGGFDFEFINNYRSDELTSQRRLILLKGYQGWVYRALEGLKAIEICSDIIKKNGYKIAIYLASPGVPEAAKELEEKTGLSIEIIPYTSHENILQLHGRSRISMGLSLSDAISTSFLEAIVMGSFPIQSCTSCANEWIINGKTGFLVPPEDPQSIAEALLIALTDDTLVDHASVSNYNLMKEKLNYKKVKNETVETYNKIYLKKPL